MAEKTRERQYQVQFEALKERGPVPLGPTASQLWRDDPRHLAFLTARYKFVSKILSGKTSALEAGCGDGFGMKLVLQEVRRVHGVDFDPLYARWCEDQAKREGLNATFSTHDLTRVAPKGPFDAAYSLDVIEHIPKRLEKKFLGNIVKSLKRHGILVVGCPNVTAAAYASPQSKAGHINLKSHRELRDLLGAFFHNVLLFSMNDEVVHTGYYPMAHYLFAVGLGRK